MIKQPWKVNLDLLTPKQQAKYNDSLEVLRLIRTGTTFSKATKLVGVTSSTSKKFLGKTLRKNKGRIVARKNDSLLRNIRIYENGKEVFIQIKGNKKAKLVAQYHSAVGRKLDRNDSIALQSFRLKKIRDSKGKLHFFETDIEKVQKIFAKREEPEFFTIYKPGLIR